MTWRERNPERTRWYAREAYRAKRAERIATMDRTCIQCRGSIPHERSARATTCSRECRYQFDLEASRHRTLEGRRGRKCERCGNDIAVTRSTKAKTCSVRCRNKLNETYRHHSYARRLTYYAIKVGRLTKRPCEECGDPDVEIHHVDYFEPLNVRWLCFKHHRTLMHGQKVKEQ